MPENFNMIPEDNIDVGRIANYLVLAENKRTRKSYPIIFHIFYALIAAMCIYIGMDGISFGLSAIVCTLCMCLGPALLTYTFIYSQTWIKAVSVALPLLTFAAKHMIMNTASSFVSNVSLVLLYILMLITAVILTKTSVSGYRKTTCFSLVSSAYVFIALFSFAMLLVYYKGSLAPSLAVKAIDDFFAAFVNETVKAASDTNLLQEMRRIIPESANLSDNEMIDLIRTATQQGVVMTKRILPAILTVTCMFFSFITVELFRVVAKIMKIDLFICVMDETWTYRPSNATTMFYDIVFFAYILSMLIRFPSNVSATIDNLLLILGAAMFVVGIRAIYVFLSKKISISLCRVICIAIVLVLPFIMGTLSILIVGSIGVMLVTARDREEKKLLAAKLISDRETYERLYSKKDETRSGNTSGDNNSDKTE